LRLGQAKGCVAIRLGAPRRLFTSRHGRIGGRAGNPWVWHAACWQQAGQSSGVRGLSRGWTRLAAAVQDRRCWCRRHVPLSQTNTTSASRSQHKPIVIHDLVTQYEGTRAHSGRIPGIVNAVNRTGSRARNYPRRREEAPQKDSRNRGKARRKVARLHQKITNQRKDFLHKLSTNLVHRFDLVSLEDLSIRGLARTKLSTSVLDAGWGMFRQFLTYKTERQDRYLMIIGRFFPSSRLCPNCSAINADLTLADRVWTCACGVIHDRDLNAARNIDTEGLRLFYEQHVAVGYPETQNVCGVSVRPSTGGTER
jgi:IS605 OrfB family transposase